MLYKISIRRMDMSRKHRWNDNLWHGAQMKGRFLVRTNACFVQSFVEWLVRQTLINLKFNCTRVQTWNIVKDRTDSNEQSFLGSNSFSAGKEIRPILWHQEFHYRMHKTPSFIPVLSQINPDHIVPSYFCKGQFNIIHSSMSRFSTLSLSFRITEQIPVCISLLPTSVTCSVHLFFLDLSTWIIFAEDWKSWGLSLGSFSSLLCNISWRLVLWWWGVVRSWPSNEAGLI